MPKIPLILSVLLGLIVRESTHLILPSAEKKEMVRSRDAILNQISVTEEIASEIKNLNVILVFYHPLDLETLRGRKLLISLSNDYMNRDRYTEVLGEVTHVGYAPNEAAIGMILFSKSFTENLHKEVRGLGYSTVAWHRSISELPLPIAIGPQGVKPFNHVRDLDGFHVQVFLPLDIARSVERIDITVNSSFGLGRSLRLFSMKVIPADWIETDYDVGSRFWRRGSQKTEKVCSLRDAKTSFRWSISATNAVWQTQNLTVWEGFRIPFYCLYEVDAF
jgi:hypothetical protein